MKRATSFSMFLLIAFTLMSTTAIAQVDAEDPFRGNYLLGRSSEIVVLQASPNQISGTVFDAQGAIDSGGLSAGQTSVVADPAENFPAGAQVDAAVGDLDGDGDEDLFIVTEGPDGSITVYVPDIDPASFTWPEPAGFSVTDAGYPKIFYPASSTFLQRYIRAVAGQFDDDNDAEIAVAYWADDGGAPAEGPIQILLFDTNGTLEPQIVASIDDENLQAQLDANGSQRGSRFDITTGDFDQDGIDEIVLAEIDYTSGPAGDSRVGWDFYAKIYRYDAGSSELLPGEKSDPIASRPYNFSQYLYRAAITSGDLDGDRRDDLAVAYEETDNELFSHIYIQTLAVSSGLTVTAVGSPESVDGSNGSHGWPLSLTAGDANYDGRDEIVLAARNTMRVFKANDELDVSGSAIALVSLNTLETQYMHRTVALTDLDLADSDSLRTEFVVMDNDGISVHQSMPAADGLNLDDTPTASASGFGFAMVVADLDGDAVRLGPPKRERRTDIVQPLVILNAPPIHFDVFGEQIFDVDECYNNNTCSHRAIYENAQTQTMEVTTQVTSDWGVSKSLSASAGISLGPISATVNANLTRTYGEGFSNVEGSSSTYRVSLSSDAIVDDRIYATVSNYDILEYPVYAENVLQGHVVAVVPQVQGVEGLQNEWFAGKSSKARSFRPNHEVGHILSYQTVAEPPPGATLFGRGNLQGGGGNTWEYSPTATQTWRLEFSSTEITERERVASQSVSRSLEGEVSGEFGLFNVSLGASVSDVYESSQISTHRTIVQEESAMSVELGTIDAGILGSQTYTVSPYIYWAGGALVLDYAVSPATSGGVDSWWEQQYGDAPDLTFILPWRLDEFKGIASSDPEVQREETRDIVFDPVNPEPGEVVSISARIQNFSLVDYLGSVTVRFYAGHPESGGALISNQNGQSNVVVERIDARESAFATLDNWLVPDGVDEDTRIYAVIDPDNAIAEVHETNNRAWNLLNPNLGMSTSREESPDLIGEVMLHQNYPNPFRSSTSIEYDVPAAGPVKLVVYDILGREVSTLVDAFYTAGRYRIGFDASTLPGGVYMYRLQGVDFERVRRMVVLR